MKWENDVSVIDRKLLLLRAYGFPSKSTFLLIASIYNMLWLTFTSADPPGSTDATQIYLNLITSKSLLSVLKVLYSGAW